MTRPTALRRRSFAANGFVGGRGENRARGECEEGAIPFALGHEQRGGENRPRGEYENRGDRARRFVWVSESGRGYARVSDLAQARLSRCVRCDAFGAASRRTRSRQRRAAGIY